MSEKRIQFKRGTAADVANQNPLLAYGEPLWVDGKLYVGDGETLLSGLTPVNQASAELADILEAVKIANTNGNGTGLHNSIYRGKYLGDSVTDEQWAAIQAGTFEGLWVGDYWTINNVNWRIHHFDYWYGTGDTECTDHHAAIVPDETLYNATVNTTRTTTGGYVGSNMYTANLAQAKTAFTNAFESGHILTVRRRFMNAITDGLPSGTIYADSTVDLMSEAMVTGAKTMADSWSANKAVAIAFHTTDYIQLRAMALTPRLRVARNSNGTRIGYWTCEPVTSGSWVNITTDGLQSRSYPDGTNGVRPVAAIYAA